MMPILVNHNIIHYIPDLFHYHSGDKCIFLGKTEATIPNIMIKRLSFLAALFMLATSLAAQQTTLPLSGKWQYKLDTLNEGIQQEWYRQSFHKEINLPGTLDDAGIGAPPELSIDSVHRQVMLNLSRKHRYIGVVWYRKEIDVPAALANQPVSVYLERALWKTSVWIDNKFAGTADNISTPQQFRVAWKLRPGKHVIVLRIDNEQQHLTGDATHAYTDGTQIKWNGVIGKMALIPQEEGSIRLAEVHPDLFAKKVNVVVKLHETDAPDQPHSLQVELGFKGKKVAQQTVAIKDNVVQITLPVDTPALWDEFTPNLYTASIKIVANGRILDARELQFGFRQLGNANSLLQINGHRLFLRGTLECGIFPLTGYPPMEKSGWIKVFHAAREYGLNHLRFHSWCPPAAAFEVADSLGFYLQVELPLWTNVGADKPTLDFLIQEAYDILATYGNHPSFCFFSMGNELEGDFGWLNHLVKELKAADKRRLYTTTAFSFGHGSWPQPEDDFYITQWTKKGWVRGQGIFNDEVPGFKQDFSSAIENLPVPVVTHEIGQYSVYPDLKEIGKYTGVLDPLNFKAIRKDLEKKHLLSLSPAYLMASGQHAANLYKEEIERALKTPGFSGFQLLGLQDFTGQGTALVGLLNAFWESKGIITGTEFSRFCGPVVPLLRFEKAVYTASEDFQAQASLANFSNKEMQEIKAAWSVTDLTGKVYGAGILPLAQVGIGNDNPLGSFSLKLKNIKKAQQLIVKLAIKGTSFSNQWNIWVYPDQLPPTDPAVFFTTSLEEALQHLNKGKTVILNPDTSSLQGVEGRYAPVFWSPVHFPNQPGTMGLLIDSKHPALRDFPTDSYSNWQWWDLVRNSKTIIIDSLQGDIQPVVRPIDNFFKNRKMAAILEAKVGKGKLILCAMDIHTDLDKRIVAKQLRFSLSRYAAGSSFNPTTWLTPQELKTFIFK